MNDVDTSHVEGACARQCTGDFSRCVSVTLASLATQMQCKEALRYCVSTCPPK